MSSSSISAAERRRLWHPRFELCAVCRSPARGFGWWDAHRSRQAPAASLVLLDVLPGALVALGAGALGHG